MSKVIRTTCAMITPICAEPNTVIEGVPDEVAAWLVHMGNAVIVADEGPEPEHYEPPVAERLAEEYAPVLEAGPVSREAPVTVQEPPAGEPMKRPYGNASKTAWVRWALHKDPELTEDAANDMSKVDLMGKYGERL